VKMEKQFVAALALKPGKAKSLQITLDSWGGGRGGARSSA